MGHKGRERRRRSGLGLALAFVAGALAPSVARWAARTAIAGRASLATHPDAAADSPWRISRRGWRSALAQSLDAFNTDRIPAVAAGATFYALLALFPALAAFVSLYGLVGDVGAAERQILALSNVLPGGAISVLDQQLARLASSDHRSLGLAFAASFAVSIASSNAGMKALIGGLNIAYDEPEQRGFVKLNLVSIAFTIGAVLFSAVALAAVVAAPALLRRLGMTSLAGASLLRWPALLAVVTGLFAVLYRLGPCRAHARWRWITPGSAVAAVGWLVMSVLFSWYVANFGHYDRTYGSLGAVIGFMTWIWLSLCVVLFGAELNAALATRTLADTTIGAKSLGAGRVGGP
jgi:membrane protein